MLVENDEVRVLETTVRVGEDLVVIGAELKRDESA